MNPEKKSIQMDYYEDKKIKAKYCLDEGKLEGEYVSYGDNDKVQSILQYKQGLLNGMCKFYDQEGQLIQKGMFKDNNLHGRMVVYQGCNPSSYFYYNNGKLDGLLVTFYENRRIKSKIEYKQGKLDGASCFYDTKGNTINEATYKDNKLDGYNIFYHPDGKILKKEKYARGLLLEVENV